MIISIIVLEVNGENVETTACVPINQAASSFATSWSMSGDLCSAVAITIGFGTCEASQFLAWRRQPRLVRSSIS
jgi:hypothetical protein